MSDFEYPCTTCLIVACCTIHCDKLVELISRAIKSYNEEGLNSHLLKSLKKHVSIQHMVMALDSKQHVILQNTRGLTTVTFNCKGKVIDRYTG